MASFISENFVPVKVHIKEQPDTFKRFRVQWTPTMVILDRDGVERHRFEGFLPVNEFLAQLELGLAHAAFAREQWRDAAERYARIVREYPGTEAAPQAQYWTGVARYKASGDAAALKETANAFRTAYQDSSWAKRASVWAK